MSFVQGRKGAALLDGFSITDYVKSGTFDADVDELETTTWGNTWRTFLPGEMGLAATIDGLWDSALASIASARLGVSPGAVLTVGLAGLAAGDRANLIEVMSTKYSESGDVGGLVEFSWAALTDTVPGFGTVLEPLAAVSADQNGTSRDGGAQTTTGGIAHLHVTSVSASDSIVVTIEDSSTGSSGWATIGTFASKSAAGAERIVIAGTIKRYVRVVDDVTGTGVSISRAVALART